MGSVMLLLLAASALVTVGLWIRVLVGDRSRGRRRCPSCWYDMSAAPDARLACPECGKDARREARLLRTRRPRSWVVASVLPLVIGTMVYRVWLRSRPDWFIQLPGFAQVAASPWLASRPELWGLYADVYGAKRGQPGLWAWERRLARRVSRTVVWRSDEPERVFRHVWLLTILHATDEDTVDGIGRIMHAHPGVQVQNEAANALGQMDLTAASESLMNELAASTDDAVQQRVIYALASLKWRRPGGRPPDLLLRAAVAPGNPPAMWAAMALAHYDPSAEVRAALLAAGRADDPVTRSEAVGGLTLLYPDDPEARAEVLAALRDPVMGPFRAHVAMAVLRMDERCRGPDRRLSAARLKFYEDAELRAALIDAMNADSTTGAAAAEPRRVLKTHPGFTVEERARVLNAE